MATIRVLVMMAIILNTIYYFGCDGLPTPQYIKPGFPDSSQNVYNNQQQTIVYLPGSSNGQANGQPDSSNYLRGRRSKTEDSNHSEETEEHHESSSKSGVAVGLFNKQLFSLGTSKNHASNNWSLRNTTRKTKFSSHFPSPGNEIEDSDTNEETEKESTSDEARQSGIHVEFLGYEAAKFGTSHSGSTHDFKRTHGQHHSRTKFTFTTEKSSFGDILPSYK